MVNSSQMSRIIKKLLSFGFILEAAVPKLVRRQIVLRLESCITRYIHMVVLLQVQLLVAAVNAGSLSHLRFDFLEMQL